jgi:ketosteroid isomerase-like protein
METMKWLMRIAGVVILVFAGWWLWQRIFVTDEQRVQRQISSMARAVETGNLFKLEAAIAQDYSDDFGFDKSTVLAAVRSFRAQQDGVLILLSDLKITVEPDLQRAQAVFIAKILAKAKGSLADSELRTDRFRLMFRKTDQGWQMTRAESPQLKFD